MATKLPMIVTEAHCRPTLTRDSGSKLAAGPAISDLQEWPVACLSETHQRSSRDEAARRPGEARTGGPVPTLRLAAATGHVFSFQVVSLQAIPIQGYFKVTIRVDLFVSLLRARQRLSRST
eukprot:g24952.t1